MGNEASNTSFMDMAAATGQEQPRNVADFVINGKLFHATTEDGKTSVETRLVDFIRDVANFKGTKVSCLEGGCGACTVSVKFRNAFTGLETTRSVSSCLVPIFSCDGWDITTVEGVGSIRTGLDQVQQRMVKCHASQCGFCSPGWVMSMNSLLSNGLAMYAKDIEDCLDSNLCRCTGYRPILEAMKSFAVDATEEVQKKCGVRARDSKKLEVYEVKTTSLAFEMVEDPRPLLIPGRGQHWLKVTSIRALFQVLGDCSAKSKSVNLVAGNTGWVVLPEVTSAQVLVDVSGIYALKKVDVLDSAIVLGGAVTISEAVEALGKVSTVVGFEYLKNVVLHWKKMANLNVRNVGTLAGNLMLKHRVPAFASDVFTVMEGVMAQVTVATTMSIQERYGLMEFLKLDMRDKVIYSVHFPKMENVRFKSYRVSKRAQNSAAYLNAAFLVSLDPSDSLKLAGCPRIVFGGVCSEMVHALKTEKALEGLTLGADFIRAGVQTLATEVQPDERKVFGSADFLRKLCQSLFYKFVLHLLDSEVAERYRSGGLDLAREVTSSKQTVESNEKLWPINEPVSKLEGPMQVTGEAEYVNDIPATARELHAAYVLAKVGNCKLGVVDSSKAMELPGVVAWIDHRNVTGVNDFIWGYEPMRGDKKTPEPIFVADHISYIGQPLGLIIAETREVARKAARLVHVTYENAETPVIVTIPQALDQLQKKGLPLDSIVTMRQSTMVPGTTYDSVEAPYEVFGELQVGGQYHFCMETHSAIAVPTEDGLEVYAAAQWVDCVTEAVAKCLGLASHKVTCHVRRLGGGFGAKLGRAILNACACAIAAWTLKRPVRAVMDLETHMSAMGKRLSHMFKYKVKFDANGKIKALDSAILSNCGATLNEPSTILGMLGFQNAYAADNWEVKGAPITTNTAPNTLCRSPGTPAAVACMETILERIAFELNKDPWQVRLANLMSGGSGDKHLAGKHYGFVEEEENMIPRMVKELEDSADLKARQDFIVKFNKDNRWRKRALAVIPTRHVMHYLFSGYYVIIVVHNHDGSVSIGHSGVEMGQGINTKVAQVAAKELGVSLDKISIKPGNSFIFGNSAFTAAGAASEMVCHSVLKASQILLKRMHPIRKTLKEPSWETLVQACRDKFLDLTAYYDTTFDDKIKSYSCWGLTATEVELDVLTGEYKIVRLDHLQDVGTSLSPAVDMGQVEGGLVMGIGLFTTEELVFDEGTGELLTNRAWTYKPPGPQEIPRDFRVSFLKDVPNKAGVLASKSTGESSVLGGVGVFIALRQAVGEVRRELGEDGWFQFNSPATLERIYESCGVDGAALNL